MTSNPPSLSLSSSLPDLFQSTITPILFSLTPLSPLPFPLLVPSFLTPHLFSPSLGTERVILVDGSSKPIRDVLVGDSVLTVNPRTKNKAS